MYIDHQKYNVIIFDCLSCRVKNVSVRKSYPFLSIYIEYALYSKCRQQDLIKMDMSLDLNFKQRKSSKDHKYLS